MKTTPSNEHKQIIIKDYNFYKRKENVSMEQLAQYLGLKPNKDGKYKCPCHKNGTERTPSMVLDKDGKHNNMFHCFGCGASGGPLQLVMAIQYGITPEEYWLNKAKYYPQLIASARFINEYFPGNLSYKDAREPLQYGELPFPTVTQKFLNKIGLTKNPRIKTKIAPDPEHPNKLITIKGLSKRKAANLIYEKTSNAMEDLVTKRDDLRRDFPDMPKEGRQYIDQVIAEEFEELEIYANTFSFYIETMEKRENEIGNNDVAKDLSEYIASLPSDRPLHPGYLISLKKEQEYQKEHASEMER